LDRRELTYLNKQIAAILDRQGEDATVESVRAEIVERIPSVAVLAEAVGAESVMETMRKLDKHIARRIAGRPLDHLRREMTRRKGVWLP
jgi:hypothetical protein